MQKTIFKLPIYASKKEDDFDKWWSKKEAKVLAAEEAAENDENIILSISGLKPPEVIVNIIVEMFSYIHLV